MGRRRAHGGRAFARRETRLLRNLAAGGRARRPVAERGHGLPAVVFAGGLVFFVGLAHFIPDQRRACRDRTLHPAQDFGDTGIRTDSENAGNRTRANRRAVPQPWMEYPARARCPLHRRRRSTSSVFLSSPT